MTQQPDNTTPVDNAGVFDVSNAAQHTQEPWEMGIGAEWNGHADGYATDIYEGATEKIVATAFDDDVITRPNATRIAASSDLLAACIAVAQATEGMSPGVQSHHLRLVLAAIAKARGGTTK